MILEKLKKYIYMLIILILIHILSLESIAAEAEISFGSEGYEMNDGEEIYIGVYGQTDSMPIRYNIEIEYDLDRLEYLDGADEIVDDNIILRGVISTNQINRRLKFKAISGGNARISVKNAQVIWANGSNERMNLNDIHPTEVIIVGEDIANTIEVPEETEEPETEKNAIEVIGEGKDAIELEVIDTNEDNKPLNVRNKSDDESLIGKVTKIVVITLVLTCVFLFIFRAYKKEQQIKKKREKYEKKSIESLRKINSNYYSSDIEIIEIENKKIEKIDIAIRVDDVSMIFKIATSNASGLKDYFIQKIKRQINYRELKAIDHVSFDVLKGEVVGIIGSNGSGKSTLLKIISGALKPSEGRVIVDRNKIQLLTLGTGFDMELTARENVFLNGAIIGYSEQFLKDNYDAIVSFAELEGFMDEKVKNFSSGMVSRLGFAIATAGNAAEILILDEVLSVGDEFFRKKSLARIKEMIHGGSTVLMVSHNTGSIIENCTKAIWIEKGVMKMIGDPKVVCMKYKNYN